MAPYEPARVGAESSSSAKRSHPAEGKTQFSLLMIIDAETSRDENNTYTFQ
jgi:hypothetical protein